ncbi:hypothetical protein [Rhizobium sp. X9]|uniref:hypothetical protein n=1 Tax=Rhizobium sp. X9 TaxID=2815360 RepID=UPI00209B8C56|nr:hypothetical protein [Rhizobium sp. X9]
MKKILLVATLFMASVTVTNFTNAAVAATIVSDLGDLSTFKTIAKDTLALVAKGDLATAKKRITDFETAWDKNEPTLYPMNKTEWGVIDDAADAAIRSLRRSNPDATEAEQAVTGLLNVLDDPVAH